jgi:hypothetical protein
MLTGDDLPHVSGVHGVLKDLASDGGWEELAEDLQPSVTDRVADETRRLRQNRRNRNRRT